MGQRSQIYIMAKDVDCGTRNEPDIQSDLLVANYYQWNYGERMVSRARGTMEWLKYYQENNYLNLLMSDNISSYKTSLSRIVDTNFDMRDVAISSNILKEVDDWVEWEKGNNPDFKATPEYFRNIVFESQDNNDGQLYIEVSPSGFKYAFIDEGKDEPMTAREYLEWDRCDGSDLDIDERKTLENNIAYIEENATLMTAEELEAFKDCDCPARQKFLERCGAAETKEPKKADHEAER